MSLWIALGFLFLAAYLFISAWEENSTSSLPKMLAMIFGGGASIFLAMIFLVAHFV